MASHYEIVSRYYELGVNNDYLMRGFHSEIAIHHYEIVNHYYETGLHNVMKSHN